MAKEAGLSEKKGIVVRTIRPTLFIGLGGTGIKVLSRIKRNMRDRFPSLAPFGYVAIDCDQIEKEKYGLLDSECAELGGFDGAKFVRQLHRHPVIARWWPKDVPAAYIEHGAGQIRPAGRLAFYGRYLDRVKPVFDQALKNLFRAQGAREQQAVRDARVEVDEDHFSVYVIGSLCGGTGAGIYFDAALAARWFINDKMPALRTTLTGIFTLAAGYEAVQATQDQIVQIRSNTYAAMKEIDHFCDPLRAETLRIQLNHSLKEFTPKVLFDAVYLLGMLNTRNRMLQEMNDLYDMIAAKVSLDVAFDVVRQSLECNPRGRYSRGKLRTYGSFGVASIRFPQERLRSFCKLRYASELLDTVRDACGEEKARRVSERVRAFRLTHRLEGAGADQLLSQLKVDSRGKPYPVGNIAAAPSRPDEIATEVVGRTKRVKLDIDDAKTAMAGKSVKIKASAIKALDKEMGDILSQCSQTGLDYATLFVNRIKAGFETSIGEISGSMKRYDPAEMEKRVENNIQAVVKQTRRGKIGEVLGSKKAAAQAFLDWSTNAQVLAQGSIELRARQLALEVCGALYQAADAWRAKINRAFTAVGNVQARINEMAAAETRGAEEELRQDFLFLEQLVLSENQIEDLYRKNKPKSPDPFLQKIFADERALGTFESGAPETVIAENILPALEGAFSGIADMDIASAMKEYGGGSDVADVVGKLLNSCAPFLQHTTEDFDDGDYPPPLQLFVALDDDRNPKYKKLIEDLRATKAWSTINCVSTGDPTEILIVTDLACLPAFAIPEIKGYAYDYGLKFKEVFKDLDEGRPPARWIHLSKDWSKPDSLPDLFDLED